MEWIPFNKPYLTGKESSYVNQAIAKRYLSGEGDYIRQCQTYLEDKIGCLKALLVHSCTAALEMAALLIDIQAGDEVIMPSYTFVSTANAFVLRGAVPVFVDIDVRTCNLDVNAIEAAINAKTKAIVPVHYAGVSCDMDRIMALANRYGLYVIEDAAQALLASYQGQVIGGRGHLSTFSFHTSKNISAGEGGALCINDANLLEKAEIIREKGTNRTQFLTGKVNKYSWVNVGSSYMPSELTGALLWAQLEQAEYITKRRVAIWQSYHDYFSNMAQRWNIILTSVPSDCTHNGHMYYIVLKEANARNVVIDACRANDVDVVFHYVPLHESTMGGRLARFAELPVTHAVGAGLFRLPLWVGLEPYLERIVTTVGHALDRFATKQVAQPHVNGETACKAFSA